MEEKEYYAEVTTNEDEIRIAKNSKKKVLTIIMRCIFGIFGADKFVMGKVKKGFETLITTLVIAFLVIATLPLNLIIGLGTVIYIGIIIIIIIVLIARFMFYLITGLKFIHVPAQEIAYIYEDL